MANARELLKRKKSIQSTGKITRTMELVASAKLKKAQEAAAASAPYASGLGELLNRLAAAVGEDYTHPLMRSGGEAGHVAVLILTSDRGLCGAFNANLVRAALKRIRHHREQGRTVHIVALARKAATTLRFFQERVDEAHRGLVEKPSFENAAGILEPLMDGFRGGSYDAVDVVYSHFHSMARQAPEALTLLPAGGVEADREDAAAQQDYLFHPDPRQLLDSLVPMAVRTRFYSCLLQTAAGEHAARRMAMKNATDAAKDLVKAINSKYNRARQGKITQEIAEIVGAVEAMS
ncbi:MAG: ATP synthase F1 subunit gamma [Planctomycetota bacterium]